MLAVENDVGGLDFPTLQALLRKHDGCHADDEHWAMVAPKTNHRKSDVGDVCGMAL
jgi:hypothetical protein